MRYFSAETAGKRRSDYCREWVIANQGIAPFRGDRMPCKKFTGKLFESTCIDGLHGRLSRKIAACSSIQQSGRDPRTGADK